MASNALVPKVARIVDVTGETDSEDVKTFTVVPEGWKAFDYMPGQCAMLSVFGEGECMISITSTHAENAPFEFSIKRVGRVTGALHELEVGHRIGVRGPYGNHFPAADWKGKNLLFIGGGIGLAPLRSVINYCLGRRSDYGAVTIVYGARSPGDLCFKRDLYQTWGERDDCDVHLTVDAAGDDWSGAVALVPHYLEDMNPSPRETVAVTCGPPIMIKFTIEALKRLGFADDQIVTTLELKMQCGVGKCGRCNIGSRYVCTDGPVFTYAQMKTMPQEY